MKSKDPLPSGDPKILHTELIAEATGNPSAGHLPEAGSLEIKGLFDFWLAPNVFVCQMQPEPCSEFCGHRENRCGNAYWRNHSALVANMMRNLARERGGDESTQECWHLTGLLHDLDYLKAPHDKPGHDEDESHPVPLVLSLRARKLPAGMTLAILEHSPHLDLGQSSRLSAALIGCDEAATLTAFGDPVAAIPGVPRSVIDSIPQHKATAPASGKRRTNIRERMLAAFQRLDDPADSFALRQ